MGTTKLKISSAKRAHHVRQKKNFSKPNRHDVNKLKGSSNTKQKTELNSREEKNKRPKKKRKLYEKSVVADGPKLPETNEDSEVEPDDVLDMLETDDLGYLGAMNFLNTNFASSSSDKPRKRKRAQTVEENNDADEHELEHSEQSKISPNKIEKALLPIKTKDGSVVERSMKMDKPLREKITALEEEITQESAESEASSETEDEFLKDKRPTEEDELLKSSKAISTADLLIKREQEINKQKYRIGIICSGILEKPEDKMKNFVPLFEFMDHKNSDGAANLTTIRKIATLSVLELFKDIIPEYRIGFIDLEKTKVKKHTMERVNFENELLRHYKKYLQKLEYFTAPISKKRKSFRDVSTSDIMVMAELAVKCLCELLLAHPYFNLSQNIAQMLVYLANSRSSAIRETIRKTVIEIYKTDQRYDLSLFIIRRTNHLIKSKSNNVYVEVIEPLLSLPLKNINLDADKEKELKQKRLEAHKARIMNLSKKEKKRQKKLKEVDKELQETQAEENKQSKQFKLTEITKMMFTIYFRILKNDPNSKLLSSTLEGLAKFAHIINIDFFEDLVNTLNYLMEHGELGYREQLHCIQTVFTILSGQGEIFNIDPCRFYTHLYKNLLEVNAGQNHGDLLVIIKTLFEVVIKRRKHITHQRLAAFVKRIATLSLQVQHNGTLGLLTIIKQSLQFNSTLEILLDTDNSIGSGRYDPELNEPEYCNAKCTALYEVSALTRHYHPTVKRIAKHIAAGIPSTGEGSLNPEFSKLSPVDYYLKYDSSEMAFNPPIPAPKNVQPKAKPGRHIFLNDNLEHYCKNTIKASNGTGEHFNFCIDFWNSLDANK